MNQNDVQGARARRGAASEPKRKRARECRPLPSGSRAAEPPRSGRNAAGGGNEQVATSDDPRVTAAHLGKVMASPITSALRVAVQAQRGVNFGPDSKQPDWGTFTGELRASVEKLRANDFSHVEEILMCQAEALQTIFTRLAERALGSTEIPTIDLFFRYGLRAQAQCRATLETLANIKNPPAIFARQANVTSGPQQINNGVAPARARESHTAPNELSGERHELRQDTRAPALASRADSPMAALGTLDGTKDASRQGEVVGQCVEGRMAPEAAGAGQGAGRTGSRG